MRGYRGLVALAMVFTVLVGGCGGGKGDDQKSSGSSSGASTSSTSPPTTLYALRLNFRYRVSTKGTVEGSADEFAKVAAATLNDRRGWTMSGQVRFDRDDEHPDFTLWLAAPDEVERFGGGCSKEYSCRSGENVVVNDLRWREGGNLEMPIDDYRQMVINHEVGHWLGLGHSECPGDGQPALLMQQQSKGGEFLGKCLPNAWPLLSERQQVERAKRWNVEP